MTGCKYPGCDYDISGHRPYSRKRDGIASASKIASMIDDGKARSFAWAATLIAATEAVHHHNNWSGLVGQMSDTAVRNRIEECTHEKDGLCKACAYLRSEFDRQWTAKADLGTHVHHLALDWARGLEVECDTRCDPYMDALERFYKDCQPEWIELERTVFYSDNVRTSRYRGQFDWIATITLDGQRIRFLGDIKTGKYYPVEQTIQLALYRYANLTTWADGKETVGKPVPTVDAAGVLLLGDDGTYQLIPLPANRDAHGTAMRLLQVMEWAKQVEKWEKDRKEREAA